MSVVVVDPRIRADALIVPLMVIDDDHFAVLSADI